LASQGSRRSGAIRGPCGFSHFLGDDGLADRRERDAGQFQVLDGERNADDGEGEADGRDNVADRQPDAGEDEPDDVAEQAEAAGADVVGLMEIENNGNTAAQNLVTALNAFAGASLWAVVGSPAGGTGTDAIRVAMIYKPGKLPSTSLSNATMLHWGGPETTRLAGTR